MISQGRVANDNTEELRESDAAGRDDYLYVSISLWLSLIIFSLTIEQVMGLMTFI